MKTKFIKTICLLIMGLSFISTVHAYDEEEEGRVRARIIETAMPAELEKELEEQYFAESTWAPGEEEEKLTESTCYCHFDYTIRVLETMGYQGSSFNLDDGSEWLSKPNHGFKVQHWPDQTSLRSQGIPASKLYITLDNSWFYDRDYMFLLVNAETNESVPVKMTRAAYPDQQFLIAKIHHAAGKIQILDYHGNHLIMNVYGRDKNIYSHWIEGQRIVVGRNNCWNYFSSPYLLINIDSGFTHVKASL